ncbi:DUF6884 domain-containing protein [Prescottella agglutinans]|uniref:DUF6884 domain-containing protein n=1 Tax=Prescottella agglutinans TaxID=1644129 RepID=A0ABT6MJU9_9NOCA|nr:DUF6884 domain-containing protein [Prescottella agglutinans]MDH6284598.1 hypothetical protein [Prescottella agglutinans]
MPPLYRPTYRFTDPTLTAPTPGRDLVIQVGLVESLPGKGPKTGGGYVGVPRAIGPLHTRLWRPNDQVEMTLPNTDLQLWTTPFITAGHRQGVFDLAHRPGWQWLLRWTIADHVAHNAAAAQGNARPLVVIPCGGAKAPHRSPAGLLYTSGVHRLAQRAARTLTGPESIRILSAKHGLLTLDELVDPYDLRLGQPKSITPDVLREQADQQGILERTDVVVLAGRDYTHLAQTVWPHAVAPLAGTGGIGDQQHRLKRIADGEPLDTIAA